MTIQVKTSSDDDSQGRQKVQQARDKFTAALIKLRQMVVEPDAEAALNYAQQLAGFAWLNSCGLFVSTELEIILSDLGRSLPRYPKVASAAGERKVLLVMSSAHGVGGHSRIAWRWVRNDVGSRVTVVLTAQDGVAVPQSLSDLQVQGYMDLVLLDGSRRMDRALQLRELAMQFDCVVLLTHPNDALALVALGSVADAPPIIFMDHAGHAFWLGLTISSIVLSMSAMCLESRRGVPRRHIGWAPLPIDTVRLDREGKFDIRESLRIPPNAPLLLTVGTAYKYWPIQGQSMASVMAPVLAAQPQAHLVVVGVALPTPFWDGLQRASEGRVHFVGYVSEEDLTAYYQACDIFVDSFPFSSPTALFEAAAVGKPVVKYAPQSWRESEFTLDIETIPNSLYVWPTPQALAHDIGRLIDDPGYRAWRGDFGQRAVRLFHAEDTFRRAIEAAYERAPYLPRIVPEVSTSGWRCEMLDLLLTELTANMARQSELESRAQSFTLRDQPSISQDNSIHERTSLKLGVHVRGATSGRRFDRTFESLRNQQRVADYVWIGSASSPWSDATWNSDQAWILTLCAGDELHPEALARIEGLVRAGPAPSCALIYSDHDEISYVGTHLDPCYKPDFNHDLLWSFPYIGRAFWLRADVGYNHECTSGASSADRAPLPWAYAVALRLSIDVGPKAFLHQPELLLHLDPSQSPIYCQTTDEWRELATVLKEACHIEGRGAVVVEGPAPGTFHVLPPLPRTPMVSIVIPTKNQLPLLSRCVETVLAKTDYPYFEVLIVDNGSDEADALSFLAGIDGMNSEQLRVIRAPGPFNFSKLNNQAVAAARGELVLMLNNDTAVLQADWLKHMVRHALRPGVGIVGARLVFPDGKLQHAGVVLGLRGPADHPAIGLGPNEPGYMFRAQLAQNFSAVTAACLLVPKAIYKAVGGLNEDQFGVSYNDIDFCLRVGAAGYRIVWTPLATLIHEGSASQKAAVDGLSSDRKLQRFTREQVAMYERWPDLIGNDPAYNPNLSLVERGYEVEINPLLCFDPRHEHVEHRVVAFAADAFGCGNYRILQPMQAMLDAGLCRGGSSPELFGPNLALRSGARTLVFQRPITDANWLLLESLLPLKGIKKIYEVDDDLSRVPMKSAHRGHIPTDMRARMFRNIGMCDRLVVSTDNLADRLRGSNDDIRVVANRLPPAMWGRVPPQRQRHEAQGRKPVVGWAGGVSHQGDLELISQVVRETADKVDWVFFGMCPDAIRPYIKEFHLGVPTLEYPQRLMELSRTWDLAVAPLEINPFNEAKSNLRLLEYGWCGLPVVCSDIAPYQGDLPVRRVKNRFKDWRSAVLDAVHDCESSRELGALLQKRVHADWMLEGDNLLAWYKAWTGD
jgi:O-antigen biosynthesis protein